MQAERCSQCNILKEEQDQYEAWPVECPACYSMQQKVEQIRGTGQRTYGTSMRLYPKDGAFNGN